MKTRHLKAELVALKTDASKDQKAVIDLILRMIDCKKAKRGELLAELAKLKAVPSNKSISQKAQSAMIRCVGMLLEHEALSQFLHFFKQLFRK